MIICLDIGNSNIFGGVFEGEQLLLRFRHEASHNSTSDQLGIFLRDILQTNKIEVANVSHIAISSVVPSLDYSLYSACKKYFNIEPFILEPGVKTGIKIKTKNPLEVGTDFIAAGIAVVHAFPKKNVIVVDMGTATTFCAINADKEFLGVAIVPGVKLSMETLQINTARLSLVGIIKPKIVTGRSTIESIQAGLYFGHLGIVKEITQKMIAENFAGQPSIIIGTGGFAHLFEDEGIFQIIDPDLVLHGIRLALENNKSL
jgi:type III pantothenate kinase